MAQPKFVFVHGSWHGGWCFDLLRLELQRRAVQCMAMDLPAMGDDETPPAEATFEAGVQRVLQEVGERRNVVLVGHSFGGFYVTEVALRMPVPPRGLIYLAAYSPLPGDTFAEISEKAPLNEEFQACFEPDAENTALVLDSERAGEFLYPDVDAGIALAAQSRLKPQPLEPFQTAAISGEEGALAKIRRRAILAEQDAVLPLDPMLSLCERAGVSIDSVLSGHAPFLSCPKDIADLLLGVRPRTR